MVTEPALDEPAHANLPSPIGKSGWPWTAAGVTLSQASMAGEYWPKVSVVTPSYNQGEYLEETIRSVLLQGYPNLEYIIIDGGSSDESVDIIRAYAPWLTYWVSEPDRGQSHAINKGFERATGQMIGWLNSDDVLLPQTLHRVVDAFSRLPDVDVVHGSLVYVDGQGNPMFTTYARDQTFELNNALQGSIYQPGAFWRKRLTEKIGLLNEDLHYVMDYEYWMRMALSGATFYQLAGEPLANFRVTEFSKTGKDQHMFGLETRELITWFLAQPELRTNGDSIPLDMRRQAMKARASANLTIAQSLSYSQDQRGSAFNWLFRSVCQYPPFLWIRRKQLFETVSRLFDLSENQATYK